MARCGCASDICRCSVVAGTGTTVTGSGTPADPFVINAGEVPIGDTVVTVADSTSINASIVGAGSAEDPYIISGVVILGTPDEGGANLIELEADGLSVSCADVRTCFSGGDSLDFDPATGDFDLCLSTDAGNAAVLGSDGCLFVPTAAAGATEVTVSDTPSVNATITGSGLVGDPYVIFADVILGTPDEGGANLLELEADGLSVSCADVRTCFTGGDSIDFDPATGDFDLCLSTDPDNVAVLGTDGCLYVPAVAAAPTAIQPLDTTSVDTTITGTGAVGDPFIVSSTVILGTPDEGGANLLELEADGLSVSCADVRTCFSGGDSIDFDPATGDFDLCLSTDAGNAAVLGTDGCLFVPAGGATAIQPLDTTSVNTTITGTGAVGDPFIVSADVILGTPDEGGANLLELEADGLSVSCADVQTCFTGGDSINITAGDIDLCLSTDAGNTAVLGTDGCLFVPATPAPITTGCGLLGTGTVADPLVVNLATEADWQARWACDNMNARSLLAYCDDQGRVRVPARPDAVFFADSASNTANINIPVGQTVCLATNTENRALNGCSDDAFPWLGTMSVSGYIDISPNAGQDWSAFLEADTDGGGFVQFGGANPIGENNSDGEARSWALTEVNNIPFTHGAHSFRARLCITNSGGGPLTVRARRVNFRGTFVEKA